MVINASVAARPENFQLALSASPTGPAGEGDTVTYILTYGWLGTNPTDVIVVQASWGLANIDGNPVNAVSYVNGSATKALGLHQPSVDVTNRQITWNISPVPTGANRTVSFQLKVNQLDLGTASTSMPVSARIIGPGITLPWINFSQQLSNIQPTPTPTPSPSPTVLPTPTTSPTPPASTASATPTVAASPTPPPGTPTPPSSGLSQIPIIGPVVGTIVDEVVAPVIEKTIKKTQEVAEQHGGAIAVPVAAAAGVPWVITFIITLVPFLPNISLGQVLSLVGILFWRQHRHPWGVVYDAHSKMPLDPVLITLTDKRTGQCHQTISDIYGRYQFVVEPGEYTLRAEKSHYAFPAASLSRIPADEIYQDLYYGDTVNVPDGGVVSVNIPMDPVDADWNQAAKQQANFGRSLRWQRLSLYMFVIGFIWSMIMAVLAPTGINVAMVIIYLILASAMLWYRRGHPWGVVYSSSRKPVAGAVVNLINLDNPQVARPPVVTTAAGRYAFLTDKGNYQVSVSQKNAGGAIWPVYSTPPLKQTKPQGHVAPDIELP
jgi:hypothetical protein